MSAELENKEKTLDKNENEIALRETEGLSQGQIIFRRFVRHKAAMTSLIVLIFIILFSYTASGIHLGDSNNKITVQGWWPYQIDQIDPEGAVASMCANGIPGCPLRSLPHAGIGLRSKKL